MRLSSPKLGPPPRAPGWVARLALVLLCGAWTGTAARGAGPEFEFFEAKVRPVLVAHCYECHSAQAKKLGGNLLLDTSAALRAGGDSGPAIVPGKPQESLLVAAIRYSDDAVHMPPKGKLPAGIVADLEAWIEAGAPDPRDGAAPAPPTEDWDATLRERRAWWSMQPVQRPEVPRVAGPAWSADPVDRFILSRLKSAGLAPAAPTDPRTLIRRLSLVLIGLPPEPGEVAEFLQDWQSAQPGSSGAGSAAIARAVDRLLASPHFGERWARHWMDVVRFTETHGNEWNYEVHHAWRYRDYLIRAFNQDVPYDQLVREHIAGDLLPVARRNTAEHFNESVIGTAFYRFGEVNHDDCIGLRPLGFDIVDNQIDTLTKAFQATTVACARCHNHKLDAVSMQDYYSLLGILRSSRRVSHTIDDREVNATAIARLRVLKKELRGELANVWLGDAGKTPDYMQAAEKLHERDVTGLAALGTLEPARLEKWLAVLTTKDLPVEDPFFAWRRAVAAASPRHEGVAAAWQAMTDDWTKTSAARANHDAEQFVTYADFRGGNYSSWQADGQSLREPPARSGDFVLWPTGERLVRAVLPAGCFTHSVSDKLNAALRSPVLSAGKKYISFEVVGERSSAVRLVSNNCQLNYKNYVALISPDFRWVTFELPADCDSLRTYAELMTMLDNPKFPDQLSALGGDKENYKLPWEKAAADPRSYFGITRVVLHDEPDPPQPAMSHLGALFAAGNPATLDDVTARYRQAVENAIRAWAADRATDDDARWLDRLLKGGLLTNDRAATPRLAELTAEYRRVESTLAVPRLSPGLADCGPGFDQPVFTRGECTRPGEPAPRQFLTALSVPGEHFATTGSGRFDLAERIARADNPLTARVMVNRVWHHVFGTGLVKTVDDFGHVGELPSHPELLDYLAARFVEEGWSIKRLIRSLVLARTFQLGNEPPPEARQVDPQNRLLSHYPARRMEAETIRDAILQTSGRLDRTLHGMSVQPFREQENADRRLFPGPLDGHGRRSVYIKNNLMEAPKFLGVFNFPGGKVACGRRDVTNVPAQALALLNDPFVLAQAEGWAERLVAREDDSLAARIDAVLLAALSRPPRDDERQMLAAAVAEFAELNQVPPSEILMSKAVWRDMAHAVYNLKEFIYIP